MLKYSRPVSVSIWDGAQVVPGWQPTWHMYEPDQLFLEYANPFTPTEQLLLAAGQDMCPVHV